MMTAETMERLAALKTRLRPTRNSDALDRSYRSVDAIAVCRRHKPFANRLAAESALAISRTRRNSSKNVTLAQGVYRCKVCALWHITHFVAHPGFR
jgi:hypothetical protein